ncbi:uncharacterized protein PHALS_14523 [Plasmopara halstedii]|uniref:Uncharacterized protein n=1 Tax=Plasmopara halstedii TaxID=4781 RepID=A0A0N7L5F4_PLAHL|nr:uncharacterized protein PHALS_14523 [Plasmopara halstedii]CEG41323.1 hypothetical protein PHALS_14523 [Plasmopara halstedii]|eukprot:XP_024577692.1 hypothetical protein PHALS_14523 [Plasmopara halstedii]
MGRLGMPYYLTCRVCFLDPAIENVVFCRGSCAHNQWSVRSALHHGIVPGAPDRLVAGLFPTIHREYVTFHKSISNSAGEVISIMLKDQNVLNAAQNYGGKLDNHRPSFGEVSQSVTIIFTECICACHLPERSQILVGAVTWLKNLELNFGSL